MKLLKKSDFLIIMVLIIVALLIWLSFTLFSSKDGTKAEIYYKSKLVKTVDLKNPTDHTFSVDEAPNIVFHVFPEGSIAFETSDCPDKVCVNSGKLSKTGQIAVCLPNEMVLKIVPKGKYKDKDADIIQ